MIEQRKRLEGGELLCLDTTAAVVLRRCTTWVFGLPSRIVLVSLVSSGLAKPLTLRVLIRGGVKVHAYRRAAYTSEPTMQRLLYGLSIQYIEIGRFQMTDDSIYPFRPNAIRCSFQVRLVLNFRTSFGSSVWFFPNRGVDSDASFGSSVCSRCRHADPRWPKRFVNKTGVYSIGPHMTGIILSFSGWIQLVSGSKLSVQGSIQISSGSIQFRV